MKAGYRPDVDGLRAVAVLAVILFHAGYGCPGGFVGVDVFFVISGYLITRLIFAELDSGSFSLAGFWERRIRRILPILTVVIAVTLALGAIHLWPDDFDGLADSALAMSLMVSNLYFWQDTGYFTGPAEYKPLLHTWSLSVEEQFYVLYPLLVLLCAGRLQPRHRAAVLAALAIPSLALNLATVGEFPAAAFYLLPPRAWELLAGGIVAVLPAPAGLARPARELLALAGLAAVLLAMFVFDRNTAFPGAAALLPVAGTAVLILATSGGVTVVAAMLAWRPLVFVGLISYSLYLWHWPLLVFARIRYADVANVELAAIVLALMLSALTWRYVETPFRRRGAGRRALVYRAALASTTVIALLSVGVAASSGMPGRAEAYGALQRDAGFDVPDAALLAGRGTPLGSPGPGTDFVVIGDSHASTLLPMLNDLAARARLSGLSLARAGRSPFGNVAGQEHIHAALLNIIESTRPSAVILVARWPNLFGRAAASRNYAENLALLEALVDAATAAGATVWVLPQVPEHALSRAAVRFQQLQALRHPGRHHAPTITRDEYAAATAAARDAFDRLQRRGARQLDISAHVFESAGPRAGQLVRGPAGMLLYWDNHHLTQSGARHLLSPLFAPLFAELAAGGAADIRKGQPRPGR